MSPFNISKPLAAPLFSEAEVQQLFSQFEAEQRKHYPGLVLDAAIPAHVFAITNGVLQASVICCAGSHRCVQATRVW